MVHERYLPGTEIWRREHADHVARYLWAVEFAQGRRVLDAGTGVGYGAALLKGAGARHVQAVDIDGTTIERARETYAVEGLDFLVDDCETLASVQGPIDVICSFENIEHLQNPERFLERAACLLADAGVLLCSTPDRVCTASKWVDGRPANPFHYTEWYREEFADLLSRYFGEVDIRAQIVSLSYLARKQAMDNLNEHLAYLWSCPSLHLGRGFRRLVGRRKSWGDISGLASASPGDYPIVPGVVARDLGAPWCHYAICRAPRR